MTTMNRPQISADFITATRRQRILDGAAEAVAILGTTHVRISELVAFAHCARKTLYDNFTGRDEILHEMFERIADAAVAVARVDGLAGLLDHLTANPNAARVLLVEGCAIDHEFAAATLTQFAWVVNAPATVQDELTVGAIAAILRAAILDGGVDAFPSAADLEDLIPWGGGPK